MPGTDINLSKEPKLTSKQHLFVIHMARMHMDIQRAYKSVFYPNDRKSPALERKIYNKAMYLWSLPRIQRAYREECASCDELAMFSRSQHLNMLGHLRDRAMDEGNLEAAIRAEVKRGEAVGMYVKRSEKVKDPIDMAKSEAQLAAIVNAHPEILNMLSPSVANMVKAIGSPPEAVGHEVVDVEAVEVQESADGG